jgi:predicted small metal-binding protein
MRGKVQDMTKTLKLVECPPECGFLVRSHDEDELVTIGVAHCRGAHGTNVSPQDIRGGIRLAAPLARA